LSSACFGKDMGFVIQKLFYSTPNPFCIFLAEIKLMQKLLLPFLLLAVTIAFGQSKYMTKSGSMSFEASQPSFEPIEATHSAVSALLNADTGELAVLALVRGFRFPLALMEEHFNENYIESHQYPKTSFKGSILNFDSNALSNQPRTVQLTGELSMHGVTKLISVSATITKSDEQITLTSSFSVKTSDFGIKIPSLVRKQIDENVQVEVSLPLQRKQ
tara:strand:+ start:1971 stop:2621 length:651 start_codon:yes stop_codon:yes gene_type:complete